MQRDSSGDSSRHVEQFGESRNPAASQTRPATRPTRPTGSSQDPVEPSVEGQSPRVGIHGTGHTPRLVRNDSSAIGVLGAADESSSGHALAAGVFCPCKHCAAWRAGFPPSSREAASTDPHPLAWLGWLDAWWHVLLWLQIPETPQGRRRLVQWTLLLLFAGVLAVAVR